MPVIKYLTPRLESIAREISFHVTLPLSPLPREGDVLRHCRDGNKVLRSYKTQFSFTSYTESEFTNKFRKGLRG